MAGVSRATVSRVVNQIGTVNPQIRSRVWQVIEEMGYQPNAAARSLVSNRSNIIGIVIPQRVSTVFAEPFFSSLLEGIADRARDHRHFLMLSMISTESEEDFYRQALRSQMLDGVIISSASLHDPLVDRLVNSDFPFVVIGQVPDRSEVSFVDVDNRQAATIATHHLIAQGRRHIATITGPFYTIPGLERLQGYQQALQEAGLPSPDDLVEVGDFTEASGYKAMQKLLAAKPDALFAASDLMAFGALRVLRQNGLHVPEDIAIVGFDDSALAALADPPLTSIRQPVYEMGKTAVDQLVLHIEDSSQTAIRTVLATQLVVRQSSQV